jgi:nicotinamidase-related amidase
MILVLGMSLVLGTSAAVASAGEAAQPVPKRMKPALIVIDIQNQYLPMVPEREKEMGLMMINWTIGQFREHGYPVIRVYHTDPQHGPKIDSEEFQFPSSVAIDPGDPRIVKNYPSAFKKTDLEKMLRDRGCNTLFLCGLSAVGCVLATYHGGIDRDFDVFMVKDALMSHNSTFTDFVEQISDTVNYKALEVMLQNAEK